MKTKIFTLILIISVVGIFSGCNIQTAERNIERIEETVENKIETAVENKISNENKNVSESLNKEKEILSEEEALAEALKHAGYTEDEIKYLRIEYDIDDKVPEYEIEFTFDKVEYEYTVHAKTGEILSFDKD